MRLRLKSPFLLFLALTFAPPPAHAVVFRPAVSGSFANAVVEHNQWWFVPGSALGGELLMGASTAVLFGASFNYWEFDFSNSGKDLTQADLDLCARFSSAGSKVTSFVSVFAGYSHQSLERSIWTGSPDRLNSEPELIEFTANGFGIGFRGGLVIPAGLVHFELSVGFRFNRFDALEATDSDEPGLPRKSGSSNQIRLAIAIPIGATGR